MAYQEKNFQSEFTKKNKIAGVFELKITKLKSLAFNRLEVHQNVALIGASGSNGCKFKIPDTGFGANPFDCFNILSYPAYVVIMFYKPRKHKMVYYVPIRAFNRLERTLLPRKSAKEKDIKDISQHIFNYLKR